MKTYKFLTFLFFFILSSNLFSQSFKTLATTTEEYNYLVKGYKTQIESGLDMKKGYDFGKSINFELDGRKIIFKELLKNTTDLRAFLAIFTGRDGRVNYICIPLGDVDSSLIDSYYQHIALSIDNSSALNFYQLSLIKLLNNYLN